MISYISYFIFCYNKTPTSQEILAVKCLSLSNSGVNKGVSCQNLLPSSVCLICLLYCTTFVIIAPPCNKSCPNLWYMPQFLPYFKFSHFITTLALLCHKICMKLIYSKFASQTFCQNIFSINFEAMSLTIITF